MPRRTLALILLWLLATACIGALLLAWPAGASAHGWYDWSCCHDQDCAPTEADVRELPDAFLIDGERIPTEGLRVLPSQDLQWHICRPPSGVRCIYKPAES